MILLMIDLSRRPKLKGTGIITTAQFIKAFAITSPTHSMPIAIRFLCLSTTLLCSYVLASNVVELNNIQFDEALGESPYTLVEFYAPC